MRKILLLTIAFLGSAAHAQYQMSRWLHADYTYTDMNYQEDKVSEKSQLPGVRGELGLNLLGFLAVSAGGEYRDGHSDFDGTDLSGSKVKQINNYYMSDLRAMAHLVYAPIVISGGLGQSEWYDNQAGSYHRRTRLTYTPLQFSYFMGALYLTVEQDLISKGTSKVTVSEGNPLAQDVQFTLGKGSGVGGEIGIYLPGQFFNSHLYLRYHKWNLKASDTQNDGIQNLTEADSTTTLVQGGVGIAF